MEHRARVGSSKRYAIQIDRAARAFSRLPSEARVVLRLCDGSRSLRSLRADAGLPAATFARVLQRLIALGLIDAGARAPVGPNRSERIVAWMRPPETLPTAPREACAAPEAPLRDPWFSSDEEVFFARGIDHLLEPEERVGATELG